MRFFSENLCYLFVFFALTNSLPYDSVSQPGFLITSLWFPREIVGINTILKITKHCKHPSKYREFLGKRKITLGVPPWMKVCKTLPYVTYHACCYVANAVTNTKTNCK